MWLNDFLRITYLFCKVNARRLDFRKKKKLGGNFERGILIYPIPQFDVNTKRFWNNVQSRKTTKIITGIGSTDGVTKNRVSELMSETHFRLFSAHFLKN